MQGPAAETHEETGAPGHEEGSGGLPQFDVAMWPGQMAWFLIFFVIVFVLMTRVFVPRIGGTIAEREGKIAGDVAEARRLKEEADAQAAAAAADTAQARAQAMKLASEARAKAQAEISARLAEEEARLAQTGAAAETRIAAARDAAMASVGDIAADAAKAIVDKLTGKAPTPAELASAAPARA
ncbi:MAG: H+transporting two-sector ATPase subunit [Phenylobacterium sp.]|nr:H+transporting two-sector ATPase subunit [Phenylobacterium sp.]